MELKSKIWNSRFRIWELKSEFKMEWWSWILDPKWNWIRRSEILRWNLDLKSEIQDGIGFWILKWNWIWSLRSKMETGFWILKWILDLKPEIQSGSWILDPEMELDLKSEIPDEVEFWSLEILQWEIRYLKIWNPRCNLDLTLDLDFWKSKWDFWRWIWILKTQIEFKT